MIAPKGSKQLFTTSRMGTMSGLPVLRESPTIVSYCSSVSTAGCNFFVEISLANERLLDRLFRVCFAFSARLGLVSGQDRTRLGHHFPAARPEIALLVPTPQNHM
jgi:hypothetical protein